MINNIEDLILQYQKAPNDEILELMEKEVLSTINYLIQKYKIRGYEYLDLRNRGLQCLDKSLKTYKIEKKVIFKTYFSFCFENELKNLLKLEVRKAIYDSISLDNEEENYGVYISNMKAKNNTIDNVLLEVDIENYSGLTDLEKVITKKLINEERQIEISKSLNISTAAVNRYVSKIRNKLSYLLII